jgi:lipopolysaccharide export system protein LptA
VIAKSLVARAPCAILVLALFAAIDAAHAEQSDREKPINFSADVGDVNYQSKAGNLTGNVVITQGTLAIRADRMTFKQNPDNSLSVTAYGNPVAFRQKRDKLDEYYEGYAQRVEYDGQKQLVELFDRALLKRGEDEIRSNYISYNTATEYFKAEGRPDAPSAPPDSGPGARVRGVFQPKGDSVPGLPGKAGAAKGDTAKDKAKEAPKPAEPLPLQPSGELAAPASK